ncbi:hypothetical protein STEG23_029296, partial [Scotinomys teguina]
MFGPLRVEPDDCVLQELNSSVTFDDTLAKHPAKSPATAQKHPLTSAQKTRHRKMITCDQLLPHDLATTPSPPRVL